jgi:Thioredoxin-like
MARALLVLFFLVSASVLGAVIPLTVKDVSLMLRSGYSSEEVLRELSTKKFADTLDSTTEKELTKIGASLALIEALRSRVSQLSAAEIAAAKEKQEALERGQKAGVSGVAVTKGDGSALAVANVPQEQQIGRTMYDLFKDDLVFLHEGSLVPFDDETLQKKKFYLLFFSAFWSKDGRQFTPRLIDYYNRVAPQHPEFEVIFCSVDRSAFAMESYISQTNMPWPVVVFDKRSSTTGAIQDALVHEVPHLILANAMGRVLSDSGNNQPNLDKVITDLDKILATAK